MYPKFVNVINVNGAPKDHFEYKIKQHHHVKLDAEFKADCLVWLQFLHGPLAEVCYRPMIDLDVKPVTSCEIGFTSDASASEKLGFGMTLGARWIHRTWDRQFILENKPSIEFLELFTLCAGILTWQETEQLVNGRVQIWCDNIVVVHMVNSLTSNCEHCMKLLRVLVLNGLKWNR